MFTLVSEIHDNADLILGMKSIFELEGVIDTRDWSFKFLNRSLPFYSKDQVIVKPKERKFIKIEAPLADEISGLVIVKMLEIKEQCTVVLKLKFVRNCASLDVTNNTQETCILDSRLLGYYKIKQGTLQQNLSKCCHFESVERLCKEFKTIVNERKKEEKEVEKDKYPWLDELEKHINLEDSCLRESEKTEVRDMIYKYREAFSLRDEIGT